MRAKTTRTAYGFEIGNLDVTITHETGSGLNLPSVEIPELCIDASDIDSLILALMEVRRDMKLRGHETGKPKRRTPAITVNGRMS